MRPDRRLAKVRVKFLPLESSLHFLIIARERKKRLNLGAVSIASEASVKVVYAVWKDCPSCKDLGSSCYTGQIARQYYYVASRKDKRLKDHLCSCIIIIVTFDPLLSAAGYTFEECIEILHQPSSIYRSKSALGVACRKPCRKDGVWPISMPQT